jgi:hypothetical protein
MQADSPFPTAPPSILGLTRWEWDAAGIRFRAWTRPIIGAGGREVVPVTLLWDHPDGRRGLARCSGFVQAMERASEVVAGGAASSVIET